MAHNPVCTHLDRRLYLLESWSAAPERRAQAKVPEREVFETKPQQAVKMLQHAWENGVPMRWVTGDEVYGASPYLRAAIAKNGRWYVLAVPTHFTVWLKRPQVAVPEWCGNGGRKPVKERVTQEAVQPLPVSAVVASWPSATGNDCQWPKARRGRVFTTGPANASLRTRSNCPVATVGCWLDVRLARDRDRLLSLQCADRDQPVDAGSTRYTIEQCIEEAKGETGLDQYEVRYWHSWHRHITLSMMAHAWLASIRLKHNREKGIKSPFWLN